MDFFGIGPFEVLLVLLIAFIVLGPERLLEMSKKAGKAMGDLRKSASDMNEKLNEHVTESTTLSPSKSGSEHQDDKKGH